MSLATGTPASDIRGIGPATSDRLAAAGHPTILDLLRASPRHLHGLVSDLASFDEVVAWRQMATLLQVQAMTPAWAEVLVGRGVNTLGALSYTTILEALALFEEARDAGECHDVPGLVDLAAILADASRLHYTGAVYGRIVDSEGEPREGLEVRLGYLLTHCDAAGRFYLRRVLLGRDAPLTCHWDPDKSFAFAVMVSPSASALVNQQLELPTKWADPVAAPDDAAYASEIDGDPLPRIAGHRVRTADRTAAGLREDDVLVVDHLYKNDPEAKLASRLRVFSGGELLVYTYRVPLSALPADVAAGDGFHVRNGALSPVEVDAAWIHRHRVRLRGRKRFAPLPASATRAERTARDEEMIAFTERELYGSEAYRS